MEKSKVNHICETSDEEIRISSALKTRNEMKRKVHNGIEKRRKDKINHWIYKIADLLPFKDPKRESKNHLLENIFQYILNLKEKNENLMFGNIDAIHAEEIRRLTKKVKELEEINLSYFRLLQTAGISPNSLPQDFRRPTKYSNKITKEEVSALFRKSFDNCSNDSESLNTNNKRINDCLENEEQNSNKKSKSKSKSKKRKERENDRKNCAPTPVLPNNLNNTTIDNKTNSQTTSSASIVLLNNQNVSTISDETPRLIVNSGSALNSFNTLQIRPTVGTQQLQILSTTPTLETMHSNSNLLSGQLLFNINPTPPQPQATAVLLPNGQILPIISQQTQQQPLIYAQNHSFLLAPSPALQSQPTIISGQTASIATNITANTIHLTSPSNKSQNQETVSTEKSKVKTTTIETVEMSPKQIKRKVSKKHKKIITPKAKSHKKEHVINDNNCVIDANKLKNSEISTEISDEIDKNVKNTNNDKNVKNVNENNDNKDSKSEKTTKSQVMTTESSVESEANNCDILAKATESIFSPAPNSQKSNQKEVQNVNEKIEKHNDIVNEKCKKRQDSQLKPNVSNQNEVISEYCANTTTANKAIELINDTNKNDNYVTSNQNNSKNEKNIAAGNKAETNKKSNNSNNDSSGSDNSHKLSNDERSAETAFHNSITTTQNSSTTNTLTFGFCNTQNDSNNNDNHNIETENELPSLLLSSLNAENEVSAESVHSVSNSSLPAFLSLSPEHLTEYLPKDSITNTTQTASTPLSANSVQFRLSSSEHNVDLHSIRHENTRIQQQKDQTFPLYSKSNEISVATTQTETRPYSTNFPTISSLINNDYSEFPINKSVIPNNSNNYLENLNPNIMNKANQQNNNFLQFPLQNDTSLMPLYPMHSYANHVNNSDIINNNSNRDLNSNTNQTFFNSNETQSNVINNTIAKTPQNPSQSRAQQQQPKPSPSQSSHSSLTQSNNIMPIRTHRNSASEQQLQPQHNVVHQEQRHTSQQPQLSRETVTSTTTVTNSMNKTTSSVPSVQYSTHNSFSSYSAEALIRQNEPSLQQIQSNDQNRYNNNSNSSRIPQQSQTQSSNMNYSDSSGVRSSSRATISYSAESLIQSNSINNSNQVTNKSSRREVENESLNATNNDNRISFYQHFNSNSGANGLNSTQRNDQNTNTLFNFDHTMNSRITTSTTSTPSLNCTNNIPIAYPQITFNSHLPDIRTSTTTTSSNSSLFPIGSNSATISSNSSRSLNTTPGNSNNNTNNNNNTGNDSNNNGGSGQAVLNSAVSQQHSPVIYQTHSQSSNTQQNKRSTNTFNSSVIPFSHSSVESYVNTSNPHSMYSTSGSLVDTALSTPSNNYQRSARNNDSRFTNCLQPTNQNANTSMTQHNNPNAGCFFSNTGPVSVHSNTTSFFPPPSATPFPPLLPSAASPFDTTTFSASHRPPHQMFANTFMTDFNPSLVNSAGNNSLTPLPNTNFNINSSSINSSNNNNNNNNNSGNKSREQQQSNTRSSSTANISRSPNPSKASKISAANNGSNTKSSSKKGGNTNKQQNTASDTSNSTSNTTQRHINSDNNYFSMSDFVSSTATTPQTNNRYSNFFPNSQTHSQSRHPVPSPVSIASTLPTNNKNTTSSADTSPSYPLFRPQSQNNGININFQSSPGSFSVNSLHNPNRNTSSTTASNFVPSSSHHSHHVPNFNLSNIFPDINSNTTETLSLSPMKFGSANPILGPPPPPPPVAPVVAPPVASSVSHSSAMDISATSYPTHSGAHHQNLYQSHHHSSRISTTHNTMPFNSFLSSGTTSTQHSSAHNFDHHITGNNRTPSTPQMTGIGNSSHSSPSFGSSHHSHSHHTYANIVPSFNFSMHDH